MYESRHPRRGRSASTLALVAIIAGLAGCKLSDSTVPPPAGLVYAVNPATYTRGVAIAPNSPSSGGGVVAGYAVSPPLPAGLAMNAVTGVVSGTPTAVTDAATYVVTASNAGGSTTVGLSLTVNDVPPAGLAYGTNPATYTVGVPIVENAPSSSGGAVIGYAVNPALPPGLAISAVTGVVSGTPTAVTGAASYRVTATNSGGSATADLAITVNDLAPGTIAYAVNPASYFATVAIAPNAPSFTGGQPATYEVTPALPAGLSLHPITGVISGNPGAPSGATTYRVTGSNSGGSAGVDVRITVNPAPPVVTVQPRPATALGGTAASFSVTATGTGALSYRWRKDGAPIPGATSASYTTPAVSAADDGARFGVVVSDPQGGTVTSDDARLTVTTPVANVYVANAGSDTLSQFSAGPDGVLVPMAVPSVGTGSGPSAVAVHPSGAWVYVVNSGDDTVSQFARALDGGLAPLATATVVTGSIPFAIAIHPQGGFAYVACQGLNLVHQYAVGVDGTLSPLGTATVATGLEPGAIAITPGVAPNYAYVTNWGDSTISQFTVAADGVLAPMTPPTVVSFSRPYSIVIDPAGTHAYAANTFVAGIAQYDIGLQGALSSASLTATAGYPRGLAIDAGGRWLYAANNSCNVTGCKTINQFSIVGGAIRALAPPTVDSPTNPLFLAIAPSGTFAWVTNDSSGSISQYAIDTQGALSPLDPTVVPAGISPSGIAAAAPRAP